MRLEENMLVDLIRHEDDVFVDAQLADEAQLIGCKHLHNGTRPKLSASGLGMSALKMRLSALSSAHFTRRIMWRI